MLGQFLAFGGGAKRDDARDGGLRNDTYVAIR